MLDDIEFVADHLDRYSISYRLSMGQRVACFVEKYSKDRLIANVRHDMKCQGRRLSTETVVLADDGSILATGHQSWHIANKLQREPYVIFTAYQPQEES